MKNKHVNKRITQLLKKKQRRLGDFLNLVLVWSYHQEEEEDCGEEYGGDDDEVENIEEDDDSKIATRSSTTSENEEESHNQLLRYYQGFHDVASIILSTLGGASTTNTTTIIPTITTHHHHHQHAPTSPTAAAASSMGLALACRVLLRLSRSHFRDALRSDFANLQSALKLVVMPLLGVFDAQLHSHLNDCEMEPYFCLSWVITWFAHDVRDTAVVKRLYDFFIVSHPLMSVYMTVAMMIHPLNRIEVLGADCDFACVHHALADLPKNSSNVGWKYLPGENSDSTGYVTGEEEEEDASSCDPSLQDQSIDYDSHGCDYHSSAAARVPFQELIDLSISLMHKIPPRNLIHLAQRYHTQIALQPLLAQASTIALLQPLPAWGLASTTESDWVLRRKLYEEVRKLNRHQRKNRNRLFKQQKVSLLASSSSSSLAAMEQQQQLCTTMTTCGKKPQPKSIIYIQAMIASGTGPDGRAEARLLRKKRQMLVRSSVVAVVFSVLVAFGKKNYFLKQPLALAEVSSHLQQQQYMEREDGVLMEEEDSTSSVAQSLLTEEEDDSDVENSIGNTVQNESVLSQDDTVTVTNIDDVTREVKYEVDLNVGSERDSSLEDISSTVAAEIDSTLSNPSVLEAISKEIQEESAGLSVAEELSTADVSDSSLGGTSLTRPGEAIEASISGTLDTNLDLMGLASAQKEEVKDVVYATVIDTNVKEGHGDESLMVHDNIISITVQKEEEGETVIVQGQTAAESSNSLLALSEDGLEKEKIHTHPPRKQQINDVCANDEAADGGFFLTNVKSSVPPPPRTENTIDKQQQSSSSSVRVATLLRVLVRSSVLFVKNLTRIQNQTLDLHLDQLEQQFDLLMMELMKNAKAAWLKIAPVLLNALHIGWHQIIKVGYWLKIAAPVWKKELSLELEEGESSSMEWAEDAMKIWKKQHLLLRNQGGNYLIHHPVVGKLEKAGKESLSKL